jgi:putative FmdB family regulatory protein
VAPIYEYSCDACGCEFEEERRIADRVPPCPKCLSDDVRRLISRTSFVLRGEGWSRPAAPKDAP